MKKNKVTSVDVAREAGVSQATVSMVLNKKYNVSFSKETIARVEAAAAHLGYHVPKQRLRKSSNQAKQIIVVCPTLTNPYYVTLLQGIEAVAKEKNYNVFVCNTQRNLNMEERLLKHMKNVRPEGIIFTANPSPDFVDMVRELARDIPTVIINNRDTIRELDAVALNNTKPGRIMARHLIDLGHRHVAFITVPLTDRQLQRSKRIDGFVQEFEESGLGDGVTVCMDRSREEDSLPTVDSEYKVGYQLTKQLIHKDKSITAFAGLNDMIAFGIIDALLEEKYKIPGDVSVIGCDNTLFSRLKGVSLTTIEHYVPLKGKDACEIILKKIEERKQSGTGEHPNSVYHIEYEPCLIKRRSTGYAKMKNK
ncbi:MAG: LacI family DNA-binding transcriptional regulator [Lachnospiraceae bacterium]|nr:LacI family DNA-binding transcriptional regulator [Lachnospiraceae bacterium]